MATTKGRTATKTTRTTTAKRKTPAKKQNQTLVARTGRTMKERPYVSAAIASGAAAVVAGIAAGAYFLKKSDKSIGEIAEDTSRRVKDGLNEASEFTSRKASSLKSKASDLVDRVRGENDPTQEEFAEEALTMKQLGEDDTLRTKTGAVAY